MRFGHRVPFGILLLLVTSLGRFPSHARASGPSTDDDSVLAIDGPPPPVFPETISRDAAGKATVQATKLSEPLRLDGQLDESVYSDVRPFGGFIQVAPKAGEPSTERSDVWVMYDAENMYVACRCWDSAPPDQWVANELKRDTNGLRQNDHFGVMFDTFYDRRSGFMFYSNPLGARADYTVIDEGQPNSDWNPVWDVKTGRFDGGWTMEMAIPFKTLRYHSGPNEIWGLQLRRSIRRKNEWTYLTPVPAFLAGPQALNRVSSAGTLVGLDLPPASKNLELKPYTIGTVTSDRQRSPEVSNELDGNLGIDVKYGVTANLTADVTINTDFAQVEIDEQQANLTRFSLFFPEKREFFLEGRGLFDFGRGGQFGGFGTVSDAPYVFYSRRIGLNRNRVIPILAGGRLTGKVGPFGIGVMNIQADDESVSRTPTTNFSVIRIKRDILKRSAIGAILTNRSENTAGTGSNQAYGVDAVFSFYENVRMNAYYARTETPGRTGDDESYQAKFDYGGDRYGVEAEQLKIGVDFNPEIGFLRRTDFQKTSGTLRFSPRPASIESIRKFTLEAGLDYFENGAGALETRGQTARFEIELESSDKFNVVAGSYYELLGRPFLIGPGVAIAPGSYNFGDVKLSYEFGQQRPVAGTVSFTRGSFYDGTITAMTFSRGRIAISNHLSLEPGFTINHLELPSGTLTQKLVTLRADYAFSPRMFASALLQYNSADSTFSSNLRSRWEYRPGSELFIVWTDERDTGPRGTGLRNRSFAVKVTRLFRL